LAVISAVIISPITARPTVVHIANSPSRATPAIAPSDRRSSSGNSTASVASSRSTSRTAATCFFIGGGPLPLSVELAVARHLPRRQVSRGGPPPHFNETGDNLPACGRTSNQSSLIPPDGGASPCPTSHDLSEEGLQDAVAPGHRNRARPRPRPCPSRRLLHLAGTSLSLRGSSQAWPAGVGHQCASGRRGRCARDCASMYSCVNCSADGARAAGVR
jgi:hypothetical protein